MTPRILDSEPIPGITPTLIFRNTDFIVVDKPAGWLTHPDGQRCRPSVTEWLEEAVGIHQRLDIDTTGILVFSRSKAGAQKLDTAFRTGRVKKQYLAVTETCPQKPSGEVNSPIDRKAARTTYQVVSKGPFGTLVQVNPHTGRTHQIRVHLAEVQAPLKGDARYGNPLDRRAFRTLLHCEEIAFEQNRWRVAPPPDFTLALGQNPHGLRRDLVDDANTTVFREINGPADGAPGIQVDRYGDWLWVQQDEGHHYDKLQPAKGIYLLEGQKDRSRGGQTAPKHISGVSAPETLEVWEHGVGYGVQLGDQLSTGLFLDHRPQRAYLAKHASGMRVLNAFAHAGAFSIAAATAGAETVSIDLSKTWLERIPRQLLQNGINPKAHDQIYGDVFHWFSRLAKRGEKFDLIILDPPSTSVGKKKKRWSAARDYPELVRLVIPLLAEGGRLWTSTNHRGLTPERFARLVVKGIPDRMKLERVCPPAVDFPCLDAAPVKTFCWIWS